MAALLFAGIVVLGVMGAAWGVGALGWDVLGGIVVPYAAAAVFVLGMCWRMLDWARRPVPYAIPTTGGQQRSLPWIKSASLDNPTTGWGVAGRLALEALTFRSLFRNTALRYDPTGPRRGYSSAKFLWLGALAFHYAMLVILVRHLRFFLPTVPWCVRTVSALDGVFEVGVPGLFVSDAVFGAALLFLLGRRLADAKVRFLSLMQDYVPLLTLLAIAGTGLWMHSVAKVDLLAVRTWALGLVAAHPALPAGGLPPIVLVHVGLVCLLVAGIPFSKLAHMAGLFFSPTRATPNSARRRRWCNPWNDPKPPRSYADYEDEFRDKMVEAGLPVEKNA